MLKILIVFLPWFLRRLILIRFYDYEISKKAKIGFSYIYPKKLIMDDGAYIGHLNVVVNINIFKCSRNSIISRLNWFTGHLGNFHFKHKFDRDPSFFLGEESSITKSHTFDCTDTIKIGKYTTIAGYNSQFLTHGINYRLSIQDCKPINIGDYCLIGTNVTVISGSKLPSFSILSAASFLNKNYDDEYGYYLFGGVPAKPIKPIDSNAEYFCRNTGFIN